MMKRLLFLAAIVLIALSFSVSAMAWSQVYGARVTGDNTSVVHLNSWFTASTNASSGATSTLPDAPAGTYGLYISSNVPVVGVRSGQYAVSLPYTAYYEAFVTWAATTSGKTNAKHVVTYAGGATNIVYLDQLSAKNYWASLGVYKFNASDAANTQIKLTNDNQTASGSLYFHSAKFVTKTPGAANMYGPANGATNVALTGTSLYWSAGLYDSFFDVYFGTDVGHLTKIGDHLGEGVTSFNLDGLLASSTKYFWVVGGGNGDTVISPTEWSFTTVPEPGSLLALGTGLLGLFGFIRRRRA